tara:strand:- start:3333 stop:3479 length:147 start_codon:yes stop_codon:yes gene_type:complete
MLTTNNSNAKYKEAFFILVQIMTWNVIWKFLILAQNYGFKEEGSYCRN